MKQLLTGFLTAVFTVSSIAAAHAAGMQGGTPADHIRPWLGTWSCKAAGNNHTATFTPIFGGNGMRISETGKMPSEEIVIWETSRSKWIDQYTDASGTYSTMEGTPSGKSIMFKQVYPAAGPTLLVTMPSKSVFTTALTMTANGKTTTQRETCTRT